MGIRGLSEFVRKYTQYYSVSEAQQRLPEWVVVDGGHLINISLHKTCFSPHDERNLNLREIVGKLLVLQRIFPNVLVVFDGPTSHPLKERYSRIKAFYGLDLSQKFYYVEKLLALHPTYDKARIMNDHVDELALLHEKERSHVRRFNYKIMTFVLALLKEMGILYYVAETEADFVMAKLSAVIASGDSDMILLCDSVVTKIIPPKKDGHICLTDDYDNEGGVVFLDTLQMRKTMLQEKVCTQDHFLQACYLSNTEINLTWTCKCRRNPCCCRPDFHNMLLLVSQHKTMKAVLKKHCQCTPYYTPEQVEKDIRTYYDPANHPETLTLETLQKKEPGNNTYLLSGVLTRREKEFLTQHNLFWWITPTEAEAIFREFSELV